MFLVTARRRPPRVRRSLAGLVTVESGSPDYLRGHDRIAMLAHWSDRPRVSRSVGALTAQLHANGYRVMAISANECDDRLDWSAAPADGVPDVVVRKPNIGYDFGSWSMGLHLAPHVRRAPRVLLVNDSLVGPFWDLEPLLRGFDEAPGDVWGLTETRQHMRHLQSFFIGFRDGVLDHPPLLRFWGGVRHWSDKWDIIRANELGLNRLLSGEGYVSTAAFRSDDYVSAGLNPVIRAWRPLLRDGFPFVKRELLRDPTVADDAELVPAVLRASYGIEVAEWL